MNLTGLHKRLLIDVLSVGSGFPLALTGGYAVQAHGLVNRLSKDLDVATETQVRMDQVATQLRAGLEERGWHVREVETDPLSARLIVTDATTGEDCELDILKETTWGPLVHTEYGPVLAIEDVVGTKVRALADRGLARDLIDVRAAARRWTDTDLEELGGRHARDELDLEELQDRLNGADWIDDTEFAAHGLDDAAIAELRGWAQRWADSITSRLPRAEPGED
ncbi:nucleotidyl transferase AbiEii/AbiGii toxin family protein [Streptomyces sp. JJ38]|uniref:nucleotidyl transferase AbiEii/AbiGii toxin family protein n=1 Tax=Streptomyces sp. JJ38 TaxID=2738128 RepID=UPI001C57A859|nr:nucleotidyl transferase AbiEii/AbiGii toxin family protein [Streptomyces sp. JJ38]MBW1597499.1 nucleotidyl transferase AbiEii/AbiGii toxin family protein [Streptomyces sp. JJ38]